MSDAPTPASAGVVVPVRAFRSGKSRLAPLLDADEREELARHLAERVVAAAGDLSVVVVSSADEVVAWAAAAGLDVIPDPSFLDAAAAAGLEHFVGLGVERVLIAHADLPLVRDLTPLTVDGAEPIVVAVPCHRDDGTPLLSLPASADFRFSYGPGSFRRHAAEARRLGLSLRVVLTPELRRDVDDVSDLVGLDGALPAPLPASALP